MYIYNHMHAHVPLHMRTCTCVESGSCNIYFWRYLYLA